MNKIISITAIIIVSASLVGMWLETEVYQEVKNGIVEVLCLSCLKLDPYTKSEFTFQTANGEKHPDFVLNNLSTGIIFLHFSEDACPGCDIMHPIVEEIFNISFGKEEMVYKEIEYENTTIHYYYTNIDHSTPGRNQWLKIYDKDHVGGLPMFTIITLGYNNGLIQPYYTTLYGTLSLDNDKARSDFLKEVIHEGIELYNENLPGFKG
ncbi:MAG: hypothetical protein DRN12_01735 [Thermoplasmata archaeon]|nr:MAG: hypothetical protein DRN12_01735 [Thermoplasmata archaeon]